MDFFWWSSWDLSKKTWPILRVGSLDQQNHSIAFGRQGEALSRDDLKKPWTMGKQMGAKKTLNFWWFSMVHDVGIYGSVSSKTSSLEWSVRILGSYVVWICTTPCYSVLYSWLEYFITSRNPCYVNGWISPKITLFLKGVTRFPCRQHHSSDKSVREKIQVLWVLCHINLDIIQCTSFDECVRMPNFRQQWL